MKEIRLTNKVTKTFQGNSRGFGLIEVMVALALLGIIAVAFLGGLATASKAIFIADERATAESLARSEMEYVKNQVYSIAPWAYTVTDSGRNSSDPPDWWDTGSPGNPPLLSSNYVGYSVEVSAESLYDDDGNILVGIQKIIVVVKHHDKEIFTFIRDGKKITLEDYKVNR